MKILVIIDSTLKDINVIESYFSTKNISVHYKKIQGTLAEYQSLAQDVVNKVFNKGVLFTMWGIDAFLVASKVKYSLVAPVLDELTAERIVSHNNAKLAIFPLNIININYAVKLMGIFLNSKFEGGRHSERICMLDSLT